MTTVTRVEREQTRKTIEWKCDGCDQQFSSPTAAESHALLVHDAPVEERESPFGPIAFLRDEKQANAWIATQSDCTIYWNDAGWYAPECTDDEGAHYRMIDDVRADVDSRLIDLREYEAALRAVQDKTE